MRDQEKVHEGIEAPAELASFWDPAFKEERRIIALRRFQSLCLTDPDAALASYEEADELGRDGVPEEVVVDTWRRLARSAPATALEWLERSGSPVMSALRTSLEPRDVELMISSSDRVIRQRAAIAASRLTARVPIPYVPGQSPDARGFRR